MKKLLALVLCVMLFVSVIPTSAFAAVDLSTAYTAQNNLYVAYAQLGAATAIKNSILGIRAMENDMNKGMLEETVSYLIYMLRQEVPSIASGLSYEGLFKRVGSVVDYAYNYAGRAVGYSTYVAIGNTIDNVNTSVTNIVNSFAPQGGTSFEFDIR